MRSKGFQEVCLDLSGLWALRHQLAHKRCLVRMLGQRGGAGRRKYTALIAAGYGITLTKSLWVLSDCSDFSPHQQMPSDLSIRPLGKEKSNY